MVNETRYDYEKVLKELVDGLRGAQMATLCGMDGIEIASYSVNTSLDPAVVDAEFASVLGFAKRSAENLSFGEIQETIFCAEKSLLVLHMIGNGLLAGLILEPHIGTLGLARLKLKKVVSEISKGLLG